MLDRLIAGAGAFAYIVDKLSAGRGGRRIGSLVGAGVLFALGILALIGWAEATDNPTPRSLTAAEATSLDDLGRRTYADVTGAYSLTTIERYRDDNGNGTQDPDETSSEWIYFLGSGSQPSGLAVRSDSPPETVFRRAFEGRLLVDPGGIADDVRVLGPDLEGVTLDRNHYVDASVRAGTPSDLAPDATTFPNVGDPVRVSGSVSFAWLYVCGTPGSCTPYDAIGFDYVVFDPVSKHGLIVHAPTGPQRLIEATVRGMIRESKSSVDDLLAVDTGDAADSGVAVSATRYLDSGSAPGNGTALLVGAIVALLLGAILLVGWGSGSGVVFRREPLAPVSFGTASIEAPVPVRVTGKILSMAGVVLERQTKASIKRITIGGPVAAPESPSMGSSPVAAAPTASPSVDGWPTASSSPASSEWQAPTPTTAPVPAGWGTGEMPPASATPLATPETGPATEPTPASVEPEPPASESSVPAPATTEGAYSSLSAAYAAAGLTPGPATAALMAGDQTPDAGETTSSAAERDLAAPAPGDPATDVLVVERADGLAGIAIGKGEARTLSSGRAVAFRGARPALRVKTDAGMLVLAFDDAASRDRVRAAIIADAGLTTDSDGISRDPAWTHSSSKT